MSARLRHAAVGLAIAGTVALSAGCAVGHQGSRLSPASVTTPASSTAPVAATSAPPLASLPAAPSTTGAGTPSGNAAQLAAVSSDLAAVNAAESQASSDLSAGDSARAQNDSAN